MSRVAKNPIHLPAGVEVSFENQKLRVKGSKGVLERIIPSAIAVIKEDQQLKVSFDENAPLLKAVAGTTRALVNNMVEGVSKGFEKKLQLNGVGYRAQAKGKELHLSLGFSHPVIFLVPEGISIETPSQTEILVKGSDKERVGEAAATIRKYRPPEPYKGKGVRYFNEKVILKEAKKK